MDDATGEFADGKVLPFPAPRAQEGDGVSQKDGGTEEERLLAACAAGDMSALGRLFDRYAVSVRRFLMRCSGAGDGDLDDLVSATFLEAFRGASGFRGRSSERTWLLGIALNISRHRRRSEGRRRAFHGLWARRDVEEGARPDDLVAGRHTLARIDAAVAALPGHLREAFLLCEVEELSGREAALLLGIPAGTLGRHLHEARKALRERLASEETP